MVAVMGLNCLRECGSCDRMLFYLLLFDINEILVRAIEFLHYNKSNWIKELNRQTILINAPPRNQFKKARSGKNSRFSS
jgi:hypothetical protein